MKLLLATGNPKKLAELVRLCTPLGLEVLAPADVGGLPEVIEDRDTFAGNAEKKAVSAATTTGLWALADDSGLEVDHLGGRPGVYSARYAGEDADDAKNNAKLLGELEGVPETRRSARFRCSLALARPDGSLAAALDGTAEGRMLEARRGDSGFGYDPLFLFTEPGHAEAGRTFAELSAEEKSRVSHRGRALAELAQRLPQLLSIESDTAQP